MTISPHLLSKLVTRQDLSQDVDTLYPFLDKFDMTVSSLVTNYHQTAPRGSTGLCGGSAQTFTKYERYITALHFKFFSSG